MRNDKNKIEQILPNKVSVFYTIYVFYFLFSTISFAQNAIDNLNYQYGNTNNQLNFITDAVSDTASGVDIDNQSKGNYAYDAIGELSKDEAEGILEILWNSAGKVKQVNIDNNNDNVADRKLEFKYDALGYRMKKIESDLTTGISETIFYVRNAMGEVIFIYQDNGSTNQRIETNIAGIGTDKITSATSASGVYSRSIGEKNYELKDQLGNVRVVISDIKEPSNFSIFQSSILNSTDYYSYGMLMPGRDYNSTSYRYGFNGKEKDNELKGNGCSYNFGARMLDTRIGKWISTDPLSEKFPSQSPYCAMGNNPINKIDPDGKEEKNFEQWLHDLYWEADKKLDDFLYKNMYSLSSAEKVYERAVELGLWEKTRSYATAYGKTIQSDGSKALDPISAPAIQTLNASAEEGINYGGYFYFNLNGSKPSLSLQAFANMKSGNVSNQNSASWNFNLGDDYSTINLRSSAKYSDENSSSFSTSLSASLLLHKSGLHFSSLDITSSYSNTTYSFSETTGFDIEGRAQEITFSAQTNPYQLGKELGISFNLPNSVSNKIKTYKLGADISFSHSTIEGNSIKADLE